MNSDPLAFHIVFGTYGFWLPNDPRGSWSTYVGSRKLREFGPATKVSTRESLAGRPHDVALRRAAKQALKYPEVFFDGHQAKAVGDGFAEAVRRSRLRILACAIMPQHVHVVVVNDRLSPEQLWIQLKGEATKMLNKRGLHPHRGLSRNDGSLPHAWARRGWCVYLDTDDDVWRGIRYVEGNPRREGKPPQLWPFVGAFVP
jgi:REP element-mobilizing transposase RayT